MTCASCAPLVRPPRRAPTRAPHLCRGRGGRGCRCHIALRLRLARPALAASGHPLAWRPARGDVPQPHQVLHHLPQHPQAPPCPA